MRFTRFISILLPLVGAISAYSQDHADCATSIFICEKTQYTVAATSGVGTPENISSTCLSEEFGPKWFRWKIAQAGNLIFLLTPTNPADDLDFAVFKLNAAGDCDDKTLVRCMAAGETVGDPTGSIPCSGSTGLAFGETDVTELPGCGNGNNNFLAPLACLPGEEYVLLVNNFTQSNSGFSLTLGGNAGLSCDSTSTAATETALLQALILYPNPVNDLLNIVLQDNHDMVQFRITDSMGSLMDTGAFTGPQHQLKLSGYSNGIYILALQQDGIVLTKRFVVQVMK